MRHLQASLLLCALAAAAGAATSSAVAAQSSLLESVKRNPNEARALCRQFKQLNAQGVSATSNTAIAALASQRNLTTQDAEILATYVIGLHCTDVS
ncbi:hypothetical protein [Synechococcus sp. UW105]|jgi:triphosphoribosyl-dephospho-CoA synthetase|uniref:hypothetical protein n=1 Tax=Synechococcus sp. UW105 TaxID=337067 RepID=UPI000C90355B|nr:hypothetical protein [Synechococcus sp. UW105]MAS28294.1 hypothetical protein [Synechococcus sp. NAT40]|tara:strand:- start:645 stop:932 length:288 start_codon:yes stop_codon:yes gene_type:complete